MFPRVGVQWILIPCLGKQIPNSPHPIIASCCFRNGIPIRASYFDRFRTNILFPFVCSLSTARSTVHSLWLSHRDPFIAISILVGSFIAVHGIPRVVTKAALIKFAPIVSVSNRTLASFPLMNIVPSRAW